MKVNTSKSTLIKPDLSYKTLNMKSSSSSSIILVALAFVALLGLVAAVAKEDLSCDSQTATECLLCCAGRNFNKFDSKLIESSKKCRCYNDEKELAFNEKHSKPAARP